MFLPDSPPATAPAPRGSPAFARVYPEHRGAALAGAGFIALAQIPRRAHYPTDIAAGLAIGLAAEKAVDVVWPFGDEAPDDSVLPLGMRVRVEPCPRPHRWA